MSATNSQTLSSYVASPEFNIKLLDLSKKADELQGLVKDEKELSSFLSDEIRQRHRVIMTHSSRLLKAFAYDRLGGRESEDCKFETREQELNYVAQVLSHLSIARTLLNEYRPYTLPYEIYSKAPAKFNPDNHFRKRLLPLPTAAGITLDLTYLLRDAEKCLNTSYAMRVMATIAIVLIAVVAPDIDIAIRHRVEYTAHWQGMARGLLKNAASIGGLLLQKS